MRRRVVVTGLGCVTPLGVNVKEVWHRLVEGQSGIGPITTFDATSCPVRIAAEVRDWDLPELADTPLDLHQQPRQAIFSLGAAAKAINSAGLADGAGDPVRFGVYLGCGETYPDFFRFSSLMADALVKGQFDRHAFFSKALDNGNLGAAYQPELNVSAFHLAGMFNAQGPNANYTSACVSASQAVGEAAEVIRRGEADLMLAGGAHSMIHPFGLTGFHRLSVLSTQNQRGAKAMRPFDRDRDGFVMGEGAAMLVLEELDHARLRGADVWGEITGYGSAQNAFRITDSHPLGRGTASCIRLALDDARLNPDQVDYINAHGTSTVENDRIETLAIKQVFGDQAYRVPISSTKSMLGHLTTACGAMELIVCLMTLKEGVIHPTINYETPDPECDLDYVPNAARRVSCRHAMSNSFGFGGQNVTLVVSKAW